MLSRMPAAIRARRTIIAARLNAAAAEAVRARRRRAAWRLRASRRSAARAQSGQHAASVPLVPGLAMI